MLEAIRNHGFYLKKRVLTSPLIKRVFSELPIHTARLGVPRDEVSSVRQWLEAQGKGEAYHLLRKGGPVRRQPPQSVQSVMPKELVEIQEDWHPDFFFAEMSRPFVLPGSGMVLTDDRRPVLESMDWPEKSRSIDDQWWWSKTRQMEGRYTIPFAIWSRHNYYHWMVEALPRLMPVVEQAWDNVLIIVPPKYRSFEQESLRLLGVPEERIVTTSCQRQLQVERLLFVSRAGAPFQTPGWALRWVADCLKQTLPKSGKQRKRRRLFISRARCKYRRVMNEDKVEALLAPYGFETVCAEDHTLAEQVELFSEAEIIVAPHGAGNTNIIFADKVRLIEFFPTSYDLGRGCYYAICDELDFPYWYLVCETVGKDDIHVDLDDLQRTLDLAFLDMEQEVSRG